MSNKNWRKRGWLQIELNRAETAKYESDANYRHAVSEKAAVMLAEVGWVGNEVRIVGQYPDHTAYLHVFKYRDGTKNPRKRSQAQFDQDDNKDTSGRFTKGPVCEFCGKPAGHDYYSDDETLSLGPYGLTLCGRKRCIAKRDALPVAERLAAYQRVK